MQACKQSRDRAGNTCNSDWQELTLRAYPKNVPGQLKIISFLPLVCASKRYYVVFESKFKLRILIFTILIRKNNKSSIFMFSITDKTSCSLRKIRIEHCLKLGDCVDL